MIPNYNIIVSEKITDSFGIYILDGEYEKTFVAIRNMVYDKLEEYTSLDYYVISKPKNPEADVESNQFKEILQKIMIREIDAARVTDSKEPDSQ
jgi:hypothetical protein